MIKRPAFAIAAGAAIAAASALSVWAAAFALYALLQPIIGAAGAYAVIAFLAALLAGLTAFLLTHDFRGKPKGLESELVELIRTRPGVALAVSLVLGVFVSKNPRLALEVAAFAQRFSSQRR
jgi:hypothetical protein